MRISSTLTLVFTLLPLLTSASASLTQFQTPQTPNFNSSESTLLSPEKRLDFTLNTCVRINAATTIQVMINGATTNEHLASETCLCVDSSIGPRGVVVKVVASSGTTFTGALAADLANVSQSTSFLDLNIDTFQNKFRGCPFTYNYITREC